MRTGGGGRALQGLYGGATTAGGGLAVMSVLSLTAETGWRAPYWSALALALVAALPTLGAGSLPRAWRSPLRALGDRRLLPLGALQAATFGLAVVAGNSAVPLLERQGADAGWVGLAGGLVLFAGIATRQVGGLLARGGRDRELVAAALAGMALGAALLASGGPLPLCAAGALVLGLAAGLPFASLFAAAQRLRPDAPAAAVSLVNGCAILAILVGTPLAGLAFELPGDGRAAFAALAALAAAALPVLRAVRLDAG